METIMLSIKPRFCELIARGEKTIEIRKTKPRMVTPIKCYIYCTKDKTRFVASGKVIGECICDKIIDARDIGGDAFYAASCMTYEDWRAYTDNTHNRIWCWHISDLVVYNNPKELSDLGIKKAPQSWCYIKEGRMQTKA